MMCVLWFCGCLFILPGCFGQSNSSLPESKDPNPDFVPAMPGKTPECAKDPRMPFCIQPENYPKERIKLLLEQNMFDTDTLYEDMTNTSRSFESSSTPEFDHYSLTYNVRTSSMHSDAGSQPQYLNESFEGESGPSQPPGPQKALWREMLEREKRQGDAILSDLCASRSNYITPRAAQTVVGDWMFIVNADEKYTQLVKSETCIQQTCEQVCDFPDGFNALCHQEYIRKRLVALDGSGGKLISESFWFPSHCVCKLTIVDGVN